MEKSIRVHILGREYALRVQEENEATTRAIARQVNEKMEAFRSAHPEQAKLTTAIITAMAFAEELHVARTQGEHTRTDTSDALNDLADRLEAVLDEGRAA